MVNQMNQIYEIGLKASETVGKHAYPVFISYLHLIISFSILFLHQISIKTK